MRTKFLSHAHKICLQMIVLPVLLVASAGIASAECCICWDGTDTVEGECWTNPGSCEDFNDEGPYEDAHCYEALSFNPTDYLLSVKDKAWIVRGKEKKPLLSDASEYFVRRLHAKYAKANKRDPKVQRQMKAEYMAFRNKRDNGKVSSARLKRISKMTGLRIVHR